MNPQVTYKPSEKVDFVIVGSGAAGGVLAKELSTAGFKVVVLEQGRLIPASDFGHDEIANRQEHALVNNFQRQPQTFRKTPQDKAEKQFSAIYGCCVGGGTVHFTANFWRFHEIDFIERSRRGPVAGTGFADWPITYAEMEQYYTKVEWEIGVSGLAGASPFDPPRSKPYPLPPMPVKSSGVIFERAAWKVGWHPFPSPMAILSQPYRGRAGCIHCGRCLGFGCEVGAKSSTLASVIPLAQQTGRCEIRTQSYAFRVKTNRHGRATGVAYFDDRGRQHFQKARAVIVSANGAETPRLLLLSSSGQFPQGLANSSGMVGKHLMVNGFSMVQATFEHPLNDYTSAAVSRVLHDFYEIDPKLGFYGGGGLDARFGGTPISFALGSAPPDVPRWGKAYKNWLAESFSRTMYVSCHATSLPVEANSFSLDPDLKDAWGLPALCMTYKDHTDDLKTVKYLQDRALELLAASPATRVYAPPVREATRAVHLLGTCRMGNDPNTSVVNADHRTHDVPNLFLCDGSSFVTSGRGQPTMTIQALAFRAADRIAAAARRGEV
ncbi:MAG: GMC family oxidoreductase [Terriglobia bacterium]|jgi:choline dehydrogenase-like flavoprotein